MVLSCFNGLHQGFQWFFDGCDDFLFTAIFIVAEGILGERLTQALEHAVVIHDHPTRLAGMNPVCPRNRLHEVVSPHRLVDTERREAFHIETRQPHRTNNRGAKRMSGIFEGGFHIHRLSVPRLESLLHQCPMRTDVEAPCFKVFHLILTFGDNDLDQRLCHPVSPRIQLGSLLHRLVSFQAAQSFGFFGEGFGLLPDFLGSGFPAWLNQLGKAGASEFINAYEHGLARFPAGREVLHKILRHFFQAVVGGDDL
ncbi:MAG: hypothetical protein SNJ52_03330, partial [Verrucomicrobiia bacterium]